MAQVQIYYQEDFEKQLAKFKQLCGKEGIIHEAKNRAHFESKKAKRERKQNEVDRRKKRTGKVKNHG